MSCSICKAGYSGCPDCKPHGTDDCYVDNCQECCPHDDIDDLICLACSKEFELSDLYNEDDHRKER